jgi:hypothetical protein
MVFRHPVSKQLRPSKRQTPSLIHGRCHAADINVLGIGQARYKATATTEDGAALSLSVAGVLG